MRAGGRSFLASSLRFVQYMMNTPIYYLCASKRERTESVIVSLLTLVLFVVNRTQQTHPLQRRHNSEVELRNVLAPIRNNNRCRSPDSPHDCPRPQLHQPRHPRYARPNDTLRCQVGKWFTFRPRSQFSQQYNTCVQCLLLCLL